MGKKDNPLDSLIVVSEVDKVGGKIVVGRLPITIKEELHYYLDIRAKVPLDSSGAMRFDRGVTMSEDLIPDIIEQLTVALDVETYPEDQILKEFKKNSTKVIKVSLRKYMGKEYVDIREFYDAEGTFKPGPKGVTIPPDCINAVIEGLRVYLTLYKNQEENK